MKKFLSIVLSVMMVLAVGFSTTVAMAATVVGSHETTAPAEDVVIGGVKVNGKNSSKVTYKKDSSNHRIITFTYEGSGEVIGWDFYDENGNKLEEPGDFTVLEEGDNFIKVEFAEDFHGQVFADVAVKGADEDSDADKDKDHKSPGTGAMAVTGLAVAGAGVAVLSALKRKNDAE